MSAEPSSAPSLYARLWIYQAERFPLGKTAILLACFTSASVNASAQLAGRPLPGWGAYIVAFLVTLILFFQLRAADEVKDGEDDAKYRPDRPIPRGLVSLRLIVGIAVGLAPVAAALAFWLYPALVGVLALVWLWLGLMTVEFFAPAWLKARPLLYLVSHMAIMPLIDLFVTATEWLPHAAHPAPALWLFLALSFANGCVLELGRKLWAPKNEREGVETYSGLYGPERAGAMWLGAVMIAYALLVGVGMAVGHGALVGVAGAAMLVVATRAALAYRANPDEAAQRRMDLTAGLWVFGCYALAGYAPLLASLLKKVLP